MRTMKLVPTVVVLATFALFNCGSHEKKTPIKQSEDVTDMNFSSFFRKFGADSIFQAQRIKYPLPYLYYPEDSDELTTREITMGRWKFRNLLDDSLSTEFMPVTEVRDSLNVIYSQKGIDNGIFISYEFINEEGRWYLFKMTNASD